MLDTGAQPNVIKIGSVNPKLKIDYFEKLQLTGITTSVVETIGSIKARILQVPVTFHVVADDFPIISQGILGSSFFITNNAQINYGTNCVTWRNRTFPFKERESIIVPPRTNTGFMIRISNPEIKTGYLPRLYTRDGVFMGDSLVTCVNNKAYARVINTLDEGVEILIPTIELQEVSSVANKPEDPLVVSRAAVNNPEMLPADHPLEEEGLLDDKKTSSDRLETEADPVEAPTLCNMQSQGDEESQSRGTEEHLSENLTPSHKRYETTTPLCDNSTIDRRDGHEYRKSTEGALVLYSGPPWINQPSSETKDLRVTDVINLLRLEHLNDEERRNIVNLIRRHHDRFHLPTEHLGKTSVTTHRIITIDDTPVHTKQYRFPPIHKQEINQQVTKLVKEGIARSSTSPYNSPVWIVPKKADSHGNKRWRMVIDYRNLNEKTIGDAYPLPNICDILDQLGGAKYFSVLDLASGFHQIPMDSADAHKTAFSTPHGHFQFERMPFGLKNAPATFQRLMDQTLSGLQGAELFVYMDDIVVYASSLREHDIKMDKLMERLREANLKLQPDKCEFLRHEVAYLGHIIGKDGVRPDPQKIAAVKNFPPPKSLKNVRQFLGLAGYYRRFIPQFSKIARPLSQLTKKETPFSWNQEQQHAFTLLKEALCKEPILQYPNFSLPFILTTDASNYAIGGVLSQKHDNGDLPIAYASRILNPAEGNYSTIEKELLAITYCTNHFRPYLYGRKFTLITDHQPLTWIHKVKDPTSRLMRWRLKLEEYDYEVTYKCGSMNKNADALSRNPPRESSAEIASIQIINVTEEGGKPSVTQLDTTALEIFPIRKKRRLSPDGDYQWVGGEHEDSGSEDTDDECIRVRVLHPVKLPHQIRPNIDDIEQTPSFSPKLSEIPQNPSPPWQQPRYTSELLKKQVRFTSPPETSTLHYSQRSCWAHQPA